MLNPSPASFKLSVSDTQLCTPLYTICPTHELCSTLSSFIPYATYEIMPYNNYASTSTLCLFHSRSPRHPVCYDILPTPPLRTFEDSTTPTSCHLWNIDTPDFR